MSIFSRVITGGIIGVFGIWFTVTGFTEAVENDYFSIVFGIFLLIVSIYIIFNKREDEIEEIKKSK